MRVARGWREGREMNERVVKKSEMIRKGMVGGRERKGEMCSRHLKIACNSVANEEDSLGDFLFSSSYSCSSTICLGASQHFIKSLVNLFIIEFNLRFYNMPKIE